MTLARWSGDAYLLTSQKLLQDQYEREFGGELQVVKGRDNYRCERYPDARVPTSQGMCRRPRGPQCHCPYARAKAAALAGPLFCTNIAYFATLRHWYGEHLPRRRLLVVDEAHNLEAQLVGATTVAFTPRPDEGVVRGPTASPDVRRRLPAAPGAARGAPARADRVDRARPRCAAPARGVARPAAVARGHWICSPSSTAWSAASRACATSSRPPRCEWVARYPPDPEATLELIPLRVADMAPALLWDAADLAVLSSAFLGPREVLAESLGLEADRIRVLRGRLALSPRAAPARVSAGGAPVADDAWPASNPRSSGRSRPSSGNTPATRASSMRRRMPRRAGWSAPSPRRRPTRRHGSSSSRAVSARTPSTSIAACGRPPCSSRRRCARASIFPTISCASRSSPRCPTRTSAIPGRPARRHHDPRWYALETAKALVQAYGRSCRHGDDYGTTYLLDGQFERFLALDRALLPEWFLEAADAALRDDRTGGLEALSRPALGTPAMPWRPRCARRSGRPGEAVAPLHAPEARSGPCGV